MMTIARDSLTEAEAVTVATKVSMLDEARSLLSRFQAMIRERRCPDLDGWIEVAARGFLLSFASGLLKDKAAVAAALVHCAPSRPRTQQPAGRQLRPPAHGAGHPCLRRHDHLP